MLKIGLTGSIGSGKSTIAAIFKVLGVPVFDADRQAKLIMQNDANLIESIKQLLGANSYTENILNRSFISNIVFNDPSKLDALNNLVHPITIRAANGWMNQQNSPYVIKEAALLFESGSTENLDFILGVTAPEHLRIERVMERDKISKEQVLAKMNHQLEDSIKMKLCDYYINNDEQISLIDEVREMNFAFELLNHSRN